MRAPGGEPMSRAATTTAPPLQLEGAQLIGVGVLLALANFMVVLDTTIANVSVPHIAGALAVSPSQGTWVITSYSVAEAITVPLTGWLVQRFGTVKIFAIALTGFGAFSILCGLAPTFGMLVAFRVLQGMMGGPIMPASQTLLLSIFPRERTGQAMSLWAATSMVAPIAGPVFGGILSDGWGWSWIFFINIPVAVIVAFGVYTNLSSRETQIRRAPVDYVGLGLLITWVGSLQIMLDRGKELEWFASTTIVTLAIVAVIGFLAFLIWELTAENPIVDLKIFRHRGFAVGAVIVSVGFGAYFSSSVLVPLWLQTSLGYTATWAGRVNALNGVSALLLSPFVGRMASRYDTRALISVGIAGMAVISLWRSQFNTDVTYWNIAATFLVFGFMIPFFFMNATMMTITSVLPEETATAAGLSNFMRTLGGAFSTSIVTTLWENTASAKRAELAGRLHDVPGALETLTGRGLTPEQARAQIDQLVQVQATMLSTNQILYFVAWIFVVVLGIVWLAPKPRLGGRGPAAGR
jgi:DHA2 family multidrug resistance protein